MGRLSWKVQHNYMVLKRRVRKFKIREDMKMGTEVKVMSLLEGGHMRRNAGKGKEHILPYCPKKECIPTDPL
jgi:hypothetical protein